MQTERDFRIQRLEAVMSAAKNIHEGFQLANKISRKRARFYSKKRYTKAEKMKAFTQAMFNLYFTSLRVGVMVSQPIPKFPSGGSVGGSINNNPEPETCIVKPTQRVGLFTKPNVVCGN